MQTIVETLRSISLFPIVLTLLCYQLGIWLNKKAKSPLVNPLLVTIILVLATLFLTGYSNKTYQEGMSFFNVLLTPATCCLAVPLYEQLQTLKNDLWVILLGTAVGATTALISIVIMSWAFRISHTLYVSLLPKSITTALSIALCEDANGIPSVTTVAIALTGLLGGCTGKLMAQLFRIKHPIAKGIAYGTSAHIMGSAVASAEDPQMGAVASLSLVVAGVITAILYPILTPLL